MSAADNKSLLRNAFDRMAAGDGRGFVDLMADDFVWIMEGTTPWSGRFEGKAVVRDRVLRPLFAQFATPYVNRAERMIAEGDDVVVLCRGDVVTNAGKRYDNSYCYVIRMQDGKMVELREYFDSALVERVLDPPGLDGEAGA